MTEKEKAEAYDEAKARMSRAFNSNRCTIGFMNEIFPELAESEDEKIRKALICGMNALKTNRKKETFAAIPIDDCITWLENQSESDEIKAKEFLINKGYPIDANGTFPTYEEMYNIIREGLEKQVEQKPKWTEEDESKVYDIIYFLNTAKAHYASTEALDDCVDWLKSLKQRIHDNFEKTCKDDTLLDLLQKMPPFITVDGVDYYFVMKKTSFYTAYYKAIGEDGSGNAIFWATAFSPIDLLTEMLEKLKNEGLLELTL